MKNKIKATVKRTLSTSEAYTLPAIPTTLLDQLPPLPPISDTLFSKLVFTHSSVASKPKPMTLGTKEDWGTDYRKLAHVGDSILGEDSMLCAPLADAIRVSCDCPAAIYFTNLHCPFRHGESYASAESAVTPLTAPSPGRQDILYQKYHPSGLVQPLRPRESTAVEAPRPTR
jgi:hypothetical protein